MYDLRLRTREFQDDGCQFVDGEFIGVAYVDRAREIVGRIVHQADHPFDQVVDILERAGLFTVAVDCDRFVAQCLDDEIRDYAAVVDVHLGAVGIENTDDFHRDAVFAVVAHEERFGTAFALVVARAQSQRVHVAPVILGLRMYQRVAVYFRGRSLQDLGAVVTRHAEHVHRTDDRSLRRLDRVVLVVDRRGGAGEVVDLLDLCHVGVDYIVPYDFEIGVFQQVPDVAFVTGKIVVDADYVVSFTKQPFA